MTRSSTLAAVFAVAANVLAFRGHDRLAVGAVVASLVCVTTHVRSSLTATGEDAFEDADPWCDYCQQEFENGPHWLVEGDRVTGYFCTRSCADAWRGVGEPLEPVGQRPTTDGGRDE